jgi:hypothetical protein
MGSLEDFGTKQDWRRKVRITERHLHNGEVWVPAASVATPITVLSNAVANTFGGPAVIINPTVEPFIDLHRMLVCNPVAGAALPADGVYHVEIRIADTRITEVEFVIDKLAGNQLPRQPVDIICPRIPAGSLLDCVLKCSTAGVQTLELRFGYHSYTE